MEEVADDKSGLRLKKQGNDKAVYYVFDTGGNVLYEQENRKYLEYVYVLGKHFARVDGNLDNSTAKKYFYHTDHLGSTVAVTDEAGQTVWTGEYTPFGGKHSIEGELDRAAKFTGKDLDEDVGLYYFNARWYDQELGRFISEDPIQDGMNWYTYASNNPLIFFDPTGLFAEQVDAVISPYAENRKIGTLGVVEETDSLDSLAKDSYGDPAMREVIIAANNLDPDKPVIKPGQVLYIPLTKELRDEEGNLKGYSFVDVAKGKSGEYTSDFLNYKHNQAINSSYKKSARFGEVTGNAQKDVMGNLAIGVVVYGAMKGGAVVATTQKLYFDVCVNLHPAS